MKNVGCTHLLKWWLYNILRRASSRTELIAALRSLSISTSLSIYWNFCFRTSICLRAYCQQAPLLTSCRIRAHWKKNFQENLEFLLIIAILTRLASENLIYFYFKIMSVKRVLFSSFLIQDHSCTTYTRWFANCSTKKSRWQVTTCTCTRVNSYWVHNKLGF